MQKRFGHRFEDGKVTFEIWAPKCKSLHLELKQPERSIPMQKGDDGWYQTQVDGLTHGDAYRFQIDGQTSRPDPAGHWFESSVHDWNRVVDHQRFPWKVDDWKGIPKTDLLVYELHIGTFTPQGTFLSAINRIDELVELGISAIEVLPLAQCPGRWNWGYDGVGIYAVQNTYGTPDDFKTFVDACHGHGIAVVVDVVFNHLGPEGNYLSQYAPFFNTKRKTPWGDGLNFDAADCQNVRAFMAQCAVDWIKNYRLDGLRVDALHFMFDDSDVPVSMEITKAVDDYAGTIDRHVHMIAETNVRNASLTKGTSPWGTGFDAAWCDGMMHCVLSIGQPGLDLCHRDHGGAKDLRLAIQQGFIYENFPYERHDRGVRADLDSCVIGFQNHDTVGNHPLGHRIHQLASLEFQKAAAALYLLYPAIPMIFMGEEFATDSPFLFFVDFSDPWVREGVEKGRASEFPELNAKLDGLSPLDPASFQRSKLPLATDGNQEMLQWYKDLIAFRKKMRACGLLFQQNLQTESSPEQGLFVLRYEDQDNGVLTVAIRLSEPSKEMLPIEFTGCGKLIFDSRSEQTAEKKSHQIMGNHALVFFQAAN